VRGNLKSFNVFFFALLPSFQAGFKSCRRPPPSPRAMTAEPEQCLSGRKGRPHLFQRKDEAVLFSASPSQVVGDESPATTRNAYLESGLCPTGWCVVSPKAARWPSTTRRGKAGRWYVACFGVPGGLHVSALLAWLGSGCTRALTGCCSASRRGLYSSSVLYFFLYCFSRLPCSFRLGCLRM